MDFKINCVYLYRATKLCLCMSVRSYKLPAVVWLRMTNYMHGWMQWELGGESWIREQRVVSVQHLEGAREVLRMETTDDTLEPGVVGNAMSDKRKNCIEAGLALDAVVTERMYGVNKEGLKAFVPIECPKMCLTRNGVLRPWTLNVSLGRRQAVALLVLLKREFWAAVEEFNREYARVHGGKKYPAISMIEAFCEKTGTDDVYAEAMRREWQRRVKRATCAYSHP